MKSLRIFLLVLCATNLAFAGDNEFRGVVRAIEGRYGVRHMHIPLLRHVKKPARIPTCTALTRTFGTAWSTALGIRAARDSSGRRSASVSIL